MGSRNSILLLLESKSKRIWSENNLTVSLVVHNIRKKNFNLNINVLLIVFETRRKKWSGKMAPRERCQELLLPHRDLKRPAVASAVIRPMQPMHSCLPPYSYSYSAHTPHLTCMFGIRHLPVKPHLFFNIIYYLLFLTFTLNYLLH